MRGSRLGRPTVAKACMLISEAICGGDSEFTRGAELLNETLSDYDLSHSWAQSGHAYKSVRGIFHSSVRLEVLKSRRHAEH